MESLTVSLKALELITFREVCTAPTYALVLNYCLMFLAQHQQGFAFSLDKLTILYQIFTSSGNKLPWIRWKSGNSQLAREATPYCMAMAMRVEGASTAIYLGNRLSALMSHQLRILHWKATLKFSPIDGLLLFKRNYLNWRSTHFTASVTTSETTKSQFRQFRDHLSHRRRIRLNSVINHLFRIRRLSIQNGKIDWTKFGIEETFGWDERGNICSTTNFTRKSFGLKDGGANQLMLFKVG